MSDDDRKPIKGEDYKMEMSPQVQAQIDANPKLAEMMRDCFAKLRQALDGATGPEDVYERMLAIGARPITDEELETMGIDPADLEDEEGDDA